MAGWGRSRILGRCAPYWALGWRGASGQVCEGVPPMAFVGMEEFPILLRLTMRVA